MRLHTSLNFRQVHEALIAARDKGRVDSAVYLDKCEYGGSRTHARAFEVKLGWYGEKVKGDGRRWVNSGRYGADSDNGTYAAFYDEWGWFIAELFKKDPGAKFGHYQNQAHFNEWTKDKYREKVGA